MKFIPPSVVSVLLLVSASQAEVTFPSDAKNTCGVDQKLLEGWFSSGQIEAGGQVSPADSLVFPAENTNCDFYHWGAQMFLWLTSPEGAGTVTFDGPNFYDVVNVSSDPSNTELAFVDNTGPKPNMLDLRTVKGTTIGGTGQAGGSDVLVSQDRALTFYGIHTNDIYATYLTLQKAGTFTQTPIAENFPSSPADMQILQEYAGGTLKDPEAMTMELKTSWVDASTVDASRYITLHAIVPDIYKGSEKIWEIGEPVQMTLALVGLHIAAPVNGHPELVWSTFEHVDNSPNATYYYLNSSGVPTEAGFDSSGTWTFLPANAPAPAMIQANASSSGPLITSKSGDPIGPVDVIQKNPWGLSPDDISNATANTDLVSLNATLLPQLSAAGDLRANYYQVGAIWTAEGQLPSGDSDPNIRGGDRLANSTMETFHQYPDRNNGFQSKNCFLCHSVQSGNTDGIALSHIFNELQPLQ